MAAPIVIQVKLEPVDVAQAGQEIARKLQSALDSSVGAVRASGKKIADALSNGAEEVLRASEAKLQAIRERGIQTRLTAETRAEAQSRVIREKALADAERDARRFAEAQERALRRAQPPDSILAFFKRYSSTLREAGESIQQAGFGLSVLTGGILKLGQSAVQSAVNLDRQVNVLKSLTGSAEAAEARFAQLAATAQKSPGLTTSLAATLDSQLRVANVTVSTIDRILPAIGKLNAVSPLGDPQKFAQNLIQLVTQNFERTDLKELVGQSPLAGELIKQIFNVDNATNAKAIRESAEKLGLTTTDAFFAAFANAAANNSKLAGVTESIGTQFEKLKDRVLVALRPLGLAVIEALQPLVEKAVPIIERLSKAFAELPDGAKQAILVIAALTAAIGPLLIALGGLIQTFGALGNIITVIAGTLGVGGTAGAAGLGGALAALAPVILPIIAAVAVLGAAFATNFGGIRDLAQEVVAEVSAQFTELRAFWREIAPDLLAILKPVLEAIQFLFETWSGTIGTIYRNAWEVVKTITREAADVIGPAIRALLALVRGDFETFGEQIERAWREAWEFIVLIPNRALLALYDVVVAGIRRLLNIGGIAKAVGESLGTSIMTGIRDAITGLFPSTVALIRGVVSTADKLRGNFADRDKARADARAASAGRGLDGEEITAADLAASNVRQIATANATAKKLGGTGAGGSAESQARQLREAQLRFTKETLDQQARLTEDANQRELRATQQLYDDKLISAQEYYETKLGIEQANLGNSINILQQEIRATEDSLRAAKANTPEKIRLESELLKLRTDLELKTRALTDAEADNQQKFLDAANKKRLELLAETQKLSLASGEKTGQLPTDLIARTVSPIEQEAQERIRRVRAQEQQARAADLEAQRQELVIQQAITAGVLTEAQGKEATLAVQRELRDVLIASLEAQKQLETDPEKLARLNLEIQKLSTLGQQLTPAQAFFKGLKSDAETLAESFERIGANFRDKFFGVVDGQIDRLTSKFKFFGSLLGDILKSLTRKVISQLFGLGGNAGGGGFGGVPSGGGFNLGGILGRLLNTGGASAGSTQQANLGTIASVFTPGFAGGNGGAGAIGGGGFNLGSVLQNLLNPGGNLSAPASVSLPGIGSLPGISIFNPGGLRGPGAGELSASGLGRIASASGGLSQLLAGIGFGKAPGSGGALAGLLPLLGVGLGFSLGTDQLTGILGGIAGGALGIGLTAAPSIIGAGGALSGLGFLAPLFSNPITAIAAAAALPAIFLLGRARQRRRDESASGDFLQDAIDAIRDLRKQVASDQLDGSQARSVFNNEILQTFIQQINTLKTKSVRESRLKNQVADLKKLFDDEVGPEIEQQKLRAKTALRLVPEFATGGIVPGIPTGADTVLSWLSPREMVLTVRQQQAIAARAGGDVFAAAGVPGAGMATADGGQAFQFGGVVQAGGPAVAPVINVYITNAFTRDDAISSLAVAAETDDGQEILANAHRVGQLNQRRR